jgi:peptidoglycan LD-endopeptidase LytH
VVVALVALAVGSCSDGGRASDDDGGPEGRRPAQHLRAQGSVEPTSDAASAENSMDQAGATKSPTARNRLAHVFPLDPPSAGDYGPGHHDYPATDIFTAIGTRFVAVTEGTVDFVSRVDEWDPAVDDPATRGGLSVAIVGDDGVRYYGSHLSKVAPGIEPGVRVEAGELLGFTGRSGNAATTAPHLHFGVSHPTFPHDWEVRRGEVDTFPLLQAWEAGRNVTPAVP